MLLSRSHFALALILVTSLAAQNPPAPKPPAFSTEDSSAIISYYSAHLADLPPSSAVPADVLKSLERGKPIPAGWEKKTIPFPAPLESRLTPLPKSHRRVVLGRRALLVSEPTSIVVDMVNFGRR